jgi:hypothetical protein
MTVREHYDKLRSGDIMPRVVEHHAGTSDARYVAWTPVWEGPARWDYAAALADLREHQGR